MIVTTLSGKNQMTVGKEIIKSLGVKRGTRFYQWVENGRLIAEPIGDLMSLSGSVKTNVPFTSFAAESEGAELSIAEEAMNFARDK